MYSEGVRSRCKLMSWGTSDPPAPPPPHLLLPSPQVASSAMAWLRTTLECWRAMESYRGLDLSERCTTSIGTSFVTAFSVCCMLEKERKIENISNTFVFMVMAWSVDATSNVTHLYISLDRSCNGLAIKTFVSREAMTTTSNSSVRLVQIKTYTFSRIGKSTLWRVVSGM